MHKVTRAVLARIAMRRAEDAGGRTATPRWKRIAASTVPLLLVAALAVTIVLTSDARTQPTSAGQTATPPAEPQQPAATPQPAHPAPARTVAIPATERQRCVDGAALAAHADNPGLADDCALLLAAKDTLRGTATLNWSATTAITDWTGVTVARASSSEPKRVTNLNLDSMSLNGRIPAELSGLSALRQLRLAWNQLTGTIPAELSQLTQLQDLVLGGNQLTGAIPPELGSLGSTLEKLHLSGPQPLPAGIGLTGSIPPQLGNLSGLKYLYLDGNRLTGSIPTRLRWLTDLRSLYLSNNELSGAIPTQLGSLSMLTYLLLTDNQLTGAIPTQLEDLHSLRKVYLRNNGGFTGCVPRGLRDVRYHDVGQLNLPVCAYGAPDTPATPLPTYTLTVTAGQGGSVDPAGATTHDEAAEVTLTASWSDATHTFAGWSGDCSGAATACTLELYADHSVTATFTELSATRCDAPEDADCIRAVYLGAPDDYPQVQDIPADLLLTPDANGRYEVERGLQVTVVTAAPLPASYTRFYLQQDPVEQPWPVSSSQLIPPVGTTYTFTPSTDPAAADLITFDLHAARPWPFQRPGLKPELGDVIVRTTFAIPPPPLTLELASSRQLCTANTLTELSWTIAGGRPPYTLTIDGQTVNANAESHRVNCGPNPADPMGPVPGTTPAKTFRASITDSQATPVTATDSVQVELATTLPVPTNVTVGALETWAVARGDILSPTYTADSLVHYIVRWRTTGTDTWTYTRNIRQARDGLRWNGSNFALSAGTQYDVSAAVMRDPIELATPDALPWSRDISFTTATAPQNVVVLSTHNTITVTWDPQPGNRSYTVYARLGSASKHSLHQTLTEGSHQAIIVGLPPDTEFAVVVRLNLGEEQDLATSVIARTNVAPEGWQPTATGPQNLRISQTHHNITATWDAPHAGAAALYLVSLNDPGTKRPFGHPRVIEQTTFTFEGLESSTAYEAEISHLGILRHRTRRTVSTNAPPDSSTSSQRSDGTLLPPPFVSPIRHFSWPIGVGPDRWMTADPWIWRGDIGSGRFHVGLDIGAPHGTAVYAAAGGMLRVANANLESEHVLYCPSPLPYTEQPPLHQQIEITSADTADSVVDGSLVCKYIVSPLSGRTALIFHGDGARGPEVTKYSHLSAFAPRIERAIDADINQAIRVSEGELIGEVGGSGPDDEFYYGTHLHFEIRYLYGVVSRSWYTLDASFVDCEPATIMLHDRVDPDQATVQRGYCGWHTNRRMTSVLDPEAHLPPLPAEAPSQRGNRAFELTTVDTAGAASASAVHLHAITKHHTTRVLQLQRL